MTGPTGTNVNDVTVLLLSLIHIYKGDFPVHDDGPGGRRRGGIGRTGQGKTG